MANEKPGGHGERSVAVGVIDMALWDAVAKARRVPLWKLLSDRYNGGRHDETAWVYAAGGYYYPGKDLEGLQDEMKHYLGLGYSCVKMKVGGVPLAEDIARIEAEHRDDQLVVHVPDGEAFVPRLFGTLSVGVSSVNVRRPSLDDVFIKYTGHDIRDAEAGNSAQFAANAMTRAFRRS